MAGGRHPTVLGMKLTDTHCHLTDGRLSGRLEEVLARAEAAGVVAAVCAAGSIADSAAAAALAERYEQVFWMAGVHPHQAKDAGGDYLHQLERLAGRAGNVAIGETGLDYHYDFSPPQVQRRVFAEQLELAKRLDKPVVIHTRQALDDTLAIVAEVRPPGRRLVFHSFTGGPDEVARVLETGCYVSFSGIATFKKSGDVRAAAALVPDDRILIETDAPYLSPEPVRKMKINEPANVLHVLRCLAAARNAAAEALAESTTSNAVRFFALDTSVRDALS